MASDPGEPAAVHAAGPTSSRHPKSEGAQPGDRPRPLTQMQHMETMRRDSRTPAAPTIQVSRRKRITPRMFCRHGR